MDVNRKFLNEFIDVYKLNSSLWDNTNPSYTSRHTKFIAYNQLLQVMRKYKTDATIIDVKKKINTLRSNYRRETKRIAISEARGDVPVYVPNLWWFEKFNFVKNFTSAKGGIWDFNNLKQDDSMCSGGDELMYDEDEDGEGEGDVDGEDDMQNYVDDTIPNVEVKQEEIPTSRSNFNETYIPQMIPKNLNETNTSFKYRAMSPTGYETIQHLCKAWAGNLRDMDKNQRIIAQRAISEIIFQGQIGALTFDSIPKLPSQMMTANSKFRINPSEDQNDHSPCRSPRVNYQQHNPTTQSNVRPQYNVMVHQMQQENRSCPTNTQPQKPEYSEAPIGQTSYADPF